MAYPIVVLTFAMCVLIGLIAFIVPVFVKVFADFGGDLPLITKFTVKASNVVTGQWYLLIIAAIAGPIAFKKWRRPGWGRPQWDTHAPEDPLQDRRHRPEDLPGPLVAHLRRALLRRRADHAGDRDHRPDRRQLGGREGMADVIESVKSGGTIADPLKDSPIFLSMVVQMIAVGEETGNLDAMLSKVADFYEGEVDAAVKALTSILEPVMIILVGGIVGFIVIAMYMPMFKVYDRSSRREEWGFGRQRDRIGG